MSRKLASPQGLILTSRPLFATLLMSHGSVQETQAGQNEQLAMLKPEDFTTGIAIMSQDGHDYKLKYSRHPGLHHQTLHWSHGAASYDDASLLVNIL